MTAQFEQSRLLDGVGNPRTVRQAVVGSGFTRDTIAGLGAANERAGGVARKAGPGRGCHKNIMAVPSTNETPPKPHRKPVEILTMTCNLLTAKTAPKCQSCERWNFLRGVDQRPVDQIRGSNTQALEICWSSRKASPLSSCCPFEPTKFALTAVGKNLLIQLDV